MVDKAEKNFIIEGRLKLHQLQLRLEELQKLTLSSSTDEFTRFAFLLAYDYQTFLKQLRSPNQAMYEASVTNIKRTFPNDAKRWQNALSLPKIDQHNRFQGHCDLSQVRFILTELQVSTKDCDFNKLREAWRTCHQHITVALQIAEDNASHRNHIIGIIQYVGLCMSYVKGPLSVSKGKFSDLMKDIKAEQLNILTDALKVCQLGQKASQKQPDFTDFLNQCNQLEKDITLCTEIVKTGAWKAEVTLEEKKAIYQAMSKDIGSQPGLHWYQCPNGHIYTIGECGGAMQASTCPECGHAIGGGGHQLTAGNRAAQDFEREVL